MCAGFDYTLSGKIEDSFGNPLSGVKISSLRDSEFGSNVFYSDTQGNYIVTSSKSQSCGGLFYTDLLFEKEGYKSFVITINVDDDPKELNLIFEENGSSLDSRSK